MTVSKQNIFSFVTVVAISSLAMGCAAIDPESVSDSAGMTLGTGTPVLAAGETAAVGTTARDAADETPVIDAIISMSKSLGLQITAEGVETEAQLAWLGSNGCDIAQGYLFSPGVPVADFIDLVRDNRGGFPKPTRRKAAVALNS